MTTAKTKSTTTPNPVVTTPKSSGGGHDNWINMQLSEISGDIKLLTQSIEHLRDKIDSVKEETSSVSTKVTRLDKIIYGATLVITVVVTLGGYFGNKAIEFGLDMAKQTHAAQIQQVQQLQQQLQQAQQQVEQQRQPPPQTPVKK